MNPQEKAKELVDKYMMFFSNQEQYLDVAKQSAIITVDEISRVVNDIWMDSFTTGESDNKFYNYWEQVKIEINKL
jgi:hypothetical protein